MIKSALTSADFIASHRLFRKRTRKGHITDLLFCLFLSAAVALYTYTRMNKGGDLYGAPTYLPLVVLVVSFVCAEIGAFIVTRLIYVWYEHRLRNMYRTDKTVQAARELQWTDERLESTSSYGTLLLPWKDIVYVREDKNYFLIYLSDIKYFPIGKANFSPAELQDFQKHLQNCPRK